MSRLHFITTTTLALALALAVGATAACGDAELPPGSFLDRDRVLGARVEVDGDPSRASPAPGERVAVRWIVEGPGQPTDHEWMLGVCAGTSSSCDDGPFVVATGESAAPGLSFDVPASVDLGARDTLWIAGEIAGTAVLTRVPISLDGAARANHNPSFVGATLLLDGAPWRESEMPVLSAAAGEVELSIALPADTRELDGDQRRETLQLSHFTSVGSLDRQYSVVEDDSAAAPEVSVAWIAPDADTGADIPSEGVVARFVFVVRDGRGGLDATTRVARVVP